MNSSFLITAGIGHSLFGAIGLGFAYLGFRFLQRRDAEDRSDADPASSRVLASIGRVNPGWWFAGFGAFIVLVCLWRGTLIELNAPAIVGGVASAPAATNLSSDPRGTALLGIGMLVASIVLALLTAWYAWSTHRYVRLTRDMLRTQTDPQVIAFTQGNPNASHQVMIVIKNFGRGIAKDVSFDWPESIESSTREILFNPSGTSAHWKGGPIEEGIRVLPPGGSVRVAWDVNAGGLRLTGLGVPIICKCKTMGQGVESEVAPIESFLDFYPDPIDAKQ